MQLNRCGGQLVAERAHIKRTITNGIDAKSLQLTSFKRCRIRDIWLSELSILYQDAYLTKHQAMSV